MSRHPNRSAYVKSPWQFEIRDVPLDDPGSGELLVEVGACAVCGTDFHVADRQAADWQPFTPDRLAVLNLLSFGYLITSL